MFAFILNLLTYSFFLIVLWNMFTYEIILEPLSFCMLVQWTSKGNRDLDASLFVFCCPYCLRRLASFIVPRWLHVPQGEKKCFSWPVSFKRAKKSFPGAPQQTSLHLFMVWTLLHAHFQTNHWQGNWNYFGGLIKIWIGLGFCWQGKKWGTSYASSGACHISLSNGVAREVD